ncbi:Icc-related predicted phosphoesterase [Zhongshania antarctica]|uniref:Icc-related predicted phosphoesterase n=1 Tax=Zhongshania antarctica TaxID=641702 RepID=A0A840R217_9GAMM|nr:metallophosphoesterase [Zhongshania antarctica]MBB5187105.1 Icc-related predicted phosphoesterase [Zhongshania antarctica]
MTKVHVRSDDHHEFYRGKRGWHPIPENAEMIILAGDIDIGLAGITWAATLGKPVLYVPGNHEYYTHNISTLEHEMRTLAKETRNVVFLQNDVYIIDDTRFLGTTLWTDYNVFGQPKIAKGYAEYGLSDHRLITHGYQSPYKFFAPEDAQKVHNRSKYWLVSELSKPWSGKTVVITHHAPHRNSIHPKFARDHLTPAFASDLTDIISNFDIELWIHGHMHDAADYSVYGTRVLCNPMGYPGTSEPDDFNPDLIVEI